MALKAGMRDAALSLVPARRIASRVQNFPPVQVLEWFREGFRPSLLPTGSGALGICSGPCVILRLSVLADARQASG
jgi:hypothetical protein